MVLPNLPNPCALCGADLNFDPGHGHNAAEIAKAFPTGGKLEHALREARREVAEEIQIEAKRRETLGAHERAELVYKFAMTGYHGDDSTRSIRDIETLIVQAEATARAKCAERNGELVVQVIELKKEVAAARAKALEEAAKLCDEYRSAANDNHVLDACRSSLAEKIRARAKGTGA